MNRISVLMPLINMVGATSTFVYFWFILPDTQPGGNIPLWYDVVFFLGGCAFLALFFILLRRGRSRVLIDVAEGRLDFNSLDTDEKAHLRREALWFPLVLAAITFGVWSVAGFIFALLEPIITAKVFGVPMPNIVLCLRRFFGILILGGGITSGLQFFIIENVWRKSMSRFFPEGELSRVKHAFRLSVRRRFLVVICGITLMPLPVLGTTIVSAIRELDLSDAAARSLTLNSLFWELLFVSLDLMTIACILAWLLAKSISEPLRQIKEVVRAVEKNDLETRVAVLSNDELGEVAEGVNRMIASLKESRRAEDSFGKYMGREIRDEILSGNISLDGEMKRVTLLFSDLRNFTGMVEKNHPREVVKVLNRYFTEMTRAVKDHKGLILQYVGDEIEAVFGAPVGLDDHPEMAVRAALAMRDRLERLNETFTSQGFSPLAHGIGIHSGAVLAGNIGSEERMSYALVGDTVNTASRIEGLAKEYQADIIISQTTRNLLTGSYETEQLPPVKVRGKDDGLIIYKLIS